MLPLLVGAGMGLASSGIGAASAAGDRAQAASLIAQSIEDYEKMGVPSVEAQKIILEELKSVGQLTPELEQMVVQGPSATSEISLDPGYKAAQLKALDELTAIGEGGGMRLSDQSQLEDILSQVRQDQRGQREAILANRRDRGISGAGSELAAQLEAQQSGATNAYKSGLDVAAQAQDRALQAIMQGGNLAGDIRGQEYGEKLDAARAADEIARFNTQNQISTGTRNVDRSNDAQRYNLGENQRIADANVGTRNQQESYNKGLQQDYFNNMLGFNQAKANARNNQASNLNAGANRTQQMWTGVGQGLAQGATQYASDQRADRKLDIEEERNRILRGA